MNLTLVISDNCKACERAIQILNKIQLEFPNIKSNIIDRNFFPNKRIHITPALLINDKLFTYGDIDKDLLLFLIN